MAKGESAKKAARQAERRRPANRSVRRRVKTFISKAEVSIAGSSAEAVAPAVGGAIVALDKAAGQGRLHRNNAARRKSRLMKKFNAAQGAP